MTPRYGQHPIDLFPELPPDGVYVDLPMYDVDTGLRYKTGRLDLNTGSGDEDAFACETLGVPYAKLQVVGFVAELVVSGLYVLAGFEISKATADGDLDLIYGPQLAFVRTRGWDFNDTSFQDPVASDGMGKRRYNIIGLRNLPRLDLSTKVRASGTIFNRGSPPTALPTAFRYVNYAFTLSARVNVLMDQDVDQGKLADIMRDLYGDDVDLIGKFFEILSRPRSPS